MAPRSLLSWSFLLLLGGGLWACSDANPGTNTGPGIDASGMNNDLGGVGPDAGPVDGSGVVDECRDLPSGAACDDENACTLEDACKDGVCVGSVSVVCDAGGPCQSASCEPATGCVYTDLVDGASCNVSCFTAATCQAGQCQPDPESAVQCPSPDPEQVCVSELKCEPSTGECTHEIYELEHAECDTDGSLCSLEECDGKGNCIDLEQVKSCEAQSMQDPCWTYKCKPLSGTCEPQIFLEGASCNDGNSCTAGDSCRTDPDNPKSQQCIGDPLPTEDGNPCTDDYCSSGQVFHDILDGVPCATGDPCTEIGQCNAGTCVYTGCECYVDDDCDDGNACLGVKSCDNGSCSVEPGTAVVCDPPASPCLVSQCQPATGQCVISNAGDGIVCDDGDPCTGPDLCEAGACTAGSGCDDGDVCNGLESCEAEVGCQPGLALDCDDDNDCTLDTCNAQQGCQYATVPDGTPCEDGDPCTLATTCSAQSCENGQTCEDQGQVCSVDQCVSVVGVHSRFVAAATTAAGPDWELSLITTPPAGLLSSFVDVFEAALSYFAQWLVQEN